MVKLNISISITISIISAVIAFAAFITSWRVQRATYRLQRQIADQVGRLRSVEAVSRNENKKLGTGFKVRNGPSKVTVTSAVISISYSFIKAGRLLRQDEQSVFEVLSDEFGVLGITGPEFSFRLGRFDEAEWRLPFLASFRLPQDRRVEGGRKEQIEFTFSVTASGNTETSARFRPGGGFTYPTILGGYWRNVYNVWGLEDLVLAVLANEAVRNIEATSPSLDVPPELKRMRQPTHEFPAGLLEWLVGTWEEAGRISDESNEKIARMLARLRSSRPNKELLVALAEAISQNQPPSASASDAVPPAVPPAEL